MTRSKLRIAPLAALIAILIGFMPSANAQQGADRKEIHESSLEDVKVKMSVNLADPAKPDDDDHYTITLDGPTPKRMSTVLMVQIAVEYKDADGKVIKSNTIGTGIRYGTESALIKKRYERNDPLQALAFRYAPPGTKTATVWLDFDLSFLYEDGSTYTSLGFISRKTTYARK
jgi:hypothetical protein